jgi:hypothetical protein
MIHLYCPKHHGTHNDLCSECSELMTMYCWSFHSVLFNIREKVTEVSRYSGLGRLPNHPILALYHAFDGRKEPQPKEKAF